MTQKEQRALTLHYLNDWIRITGEGYDATFTYAKASQFLNDFLMLETDATQGSFRLSLTYIDDDCTLGTAYLVVLRNAATNNKPERCELIPDFHALSFDSNKNDLLLSGVSVLRCDSERRNASLFGGTNLANMVVARSALTHPPMKFAPLSSQCREARVAENLAVENALKAFHSRYVALTHVLCHLDPDTGSLVPVTPFSNSLKKSAALSETRYLPYSIRLKTALLVAELEKAGYPRNWLANLYAFSDTQQHCINPLIKSSATFHIDDVQYLDNESLYEAATAIRNDAVALFRNELNKSRQEGRCETLLRNWLDVTNDEERALIFEAALSLNSGMGTSELKSLATRYCEQYANNRLMDLSLFGGATDTSLTT
ncbi:hypothetical protein [Alteromonas sp. 14N.309.X.WAT.G.H12]|uniref:hypothetical protein n=1 Tax=Alteromonas sp. 14N.309.X.WAT.G.H12 TaxID=3120824 RepID=UPI002FD355F7